jgi:hypothetical protein
MIRKKEPAAEGESTPDRCSSRRLRVGKQHARRIIVPRTIYLETSDWTASPCYGCGTYCCSHLPLCDLSIETRTDLMKAADLCRFEGMVPVLKQDGQWRLFYHADCRYLHRPTAKCIIHNTPQQSHICRDYPAARCWYRKAFETPETDHLLRFNRARLERLTALCDFDERGAIVSVPEWDRLKQELASIPYDSAPASRRKMETAADSAHPSRQPQLLLFPPGKPERAQHFDLLRFRLGFPGALMLKSFSLWCFALPALAVGGTSPAETRILLKRLESGVYDAIIDGITEHERYMLTTGSFSRIRSIDGLDREPETDADYRQSKAENL